MQPGTSLTRRVTKSNTPLAAKRLNRETVGYEAGAAVMMPTKSSTFKLAPPTNAPSMFG